MCDEGGGGGGNGSVVGFGKNTKLKKRASYGAGKLRHTVSSVVLALFAARVSI